MVELRSALGLLLVLGSLAGQQEDQEIVGEFQKIFRRFKDRPTRVEAVLALEGVESPSVVPALLPVLGDEDPEVARVGVRVLAGFDTRPPVDALIAALASKPSDKVRLGLLQAIADGRYAGASEPLLEALADPAWAIRRGAAMALAATADPRADESLVLLARDPEPAVRSGVLEALASTGSRKTVELGLAALRDDSWQVRASAIGALARVRDKASIEPLIRELETEEGRLKADAAAALAAITGRDFGESPEPWRRFWDANAERYEIPTDAELAKLRAKRAESAERYRPPGTVSYHGIETPSRRILFVIDVSGSMEQRVMEKERFADGGYPSLERIDIVKTELARTVERLGAEVKFDILAFATDVRRWRGKLVPANVLNKSAAASWVGRLTAIGGPSKEDLALVGLVGAADLEGGKTNSYGALMQALGADGKGGRGDYEVEVDTIFFLSDGRPSHGLFTMPDDVLREVRKANELRKVVIHTIGIGDVEMEFMRQLAEQNGGQFVNLGR